MKPIEPSLVCKDGATVSVQASQYHYSTPRNDRGPYSHVEAGFPSVIPPDSWSEYAENWHSLTTRQLAKDILGDINMAWYSFKYRKFKWNFSTKHWLRSALLRLRGLKPTDTIYPWLPIELVDEFIEVHGGKKSS